MSLEAAPEALTRELGWSLNRFLVFEQRNLWNPKRLRAATGDPEFDERYLPESCAVFPVPGFWVLRKHLYVYGNQKCRASGPFSARGGGPDEPVLLPIHPAERLRHEEFLRRVKAVDAAAEGLRLLGTPTSSTRTLLVWPMGQPELAAFVKFSLHTRLFGDRTLQRRKVAGSIGLSRLVDESGGALPRGLSCFPESLGVVPRQMPDNGVIVRSIPDEIKRGAVVPAPLFALMGGDPTHRPVLLEVMGREGAEGLEELAALLFARFAEIWVDLVFSLGLILEAHGQDLLLALSRDMAPLGHLYYRDFEGLTVDWNLRRSMGLAEPMPMPHAHDWYDTYETWGYPKNQLVSWKMRTSLYDYLYFVLAELGSAVKDWHASGIMAGPPPWQEELTLVFSRNVRQVIYERFGMRETHEYDVSKDIIRFVTFLMVVRREVIYAGGHR